MYCPICNVQLIEALRLGSKVRICPECCGEWVSQSLMDRLTIAATARESPAAAAPQSQQANPEDERQEDLFNWF